MDVCQAMRKETHRRFKELSEEGDGCLLSLRNIDKRVGQSFLHLKEARSSIQSINRTRKIIYKKNTHT